METEFGPGGEVRVVLSRTVISALAAGMQFYTRLSLVIEHGRRLSSRRLERRGALLNTTVFSRNFYVFEVVLDRTTAEVNFYGIDFP